MNGYAVRIAPRGPETYDHFGRNVLILLLLGIGVFISTYFKNRK